MSMLFQWLRRKKESRPSGRPARRFRRPLLETLEDRVLPTATWVGGHGTDWGTAANWSGGTGTNGLPGPNDDVVINLPGVIVTHSAGSDTVKSLTVNDTLTLSGGTLTVTSGVTINDQIDIGAADGSTSGNLTFAGTQTLGGTGFLIFGGSSSNTVSIPSGDTLTVASGITVDGQSGFFGTPSVDFNNSGGSIVNQGTIAADDAGQPAGAAAGTLSILTDGGLTNRSTGTLEASNGGTLTLFWNAGQTAISWSNAGNLSVNNGTLNLGGVFTPADLAGFSRSGGQVNLVGTLTNNNSPGLVLNDTTGPWNLAGGEIDNGTITTLGNNALVAIAGGYQESTLNGVTLAGTLDMASASVSEVRVINGLTLDSATIPLGNAAGTTFAIMTFDGTQTLGGTGTLRFGGYLNNGVSIPAGDTLTVGSDITVDGQSGFFGTPSVEFNNSGGSIVNQGTIAADDAGQPAGTAAGTLSILTDGGLTNSGTLDATNGGTLTLFNFAGQFPVGGSPTPWSSSGAISVNNGILNLGGIFTPADVANFSRSGGTVNLIGNLTNNNAPGLVLNDTTGSWNLLGGEIDGGTISTVGNDALLAIAGGYQESTLNGVTLAGTLDMASASVSEVRVINGLTLDSATIPLGNAAGTTFAIMTFDGTQTLGGTGTLRFGGYLNNGVSIPAGDILTVGPGITVDGQSGFFGTPSVDFPFSGGSIVNQGIIAADDAGQPAGAPAGTLSILTNGGLTTTGTLEANNGGTLKVEAFTNSGGVTIGANSALTVVGDYSQSSGTTDVAGTLTANNVNLNGGALAGSGTIQGNLFNASQIGLGSTPEILTVQGNYTQTAAGALNLQIAGTTAGTEYDQLNVSESAALDGALNVTLANGFSPAGQSFTLMTFANHMGAFATTTGVPAGEALNLTATALGLAAAPADPATSIVTIAPADIAVGATATVTLQAKDASGDNLTTGGLTVEFGLGSDGGSGTFGAVTDEGNGTYQATFTATAAGTNTIIATINGAPVTTTAPSVTITDVADPAQSVVTVTPASIVVGATATVSLQAKDSLGNNLTTGGLTVVLGLGSDGGSGTFSAVTDNGDGTYQATFTATAVGTNTIIATINGASVTTTAPRITITGVADPSQSMITVTPPNIVVGAAATVSLQAKDSQGNNLTTGGLTVVFGLGSDGGSGMFGAVTDNGDGTYQATFTATAVGTNTIIATINGAPVTTTAPGVTITAAADPSQSVVTVTPASIIVGTTTTVVLQAKDSNGNDITTGGSTVTFDLGTGTGDGTFSTVTDNGDGTYQAMFTASAAGGNTITATIDGAAVTSTAPTVTITTANVVHWLNPAGGDWDTAANWLGGVIPGANDDVVIDVAVTNPITHAQNVTDQINSLSVTANDPLDLSAGVLQVASKLDSNGAVRLLGGTLADATVSAATTVTATQSGGTLDGLTLDGFLDLASNTDSTAVLTSGLIFSDGTIYIGQGGVLTLPGPEAITGTGRVHFADANSNNSVSETGTDTFTIGPNVTIDGNTGQVDGGSGGFVNQGTMIDDVADGLMTLKGTSWSNTGTIGAGMGGGFKLDGTWTNSGTLQALGGSTASLDGTSWSNTGTFTAIDSTVNLGGIFTTEGLGNFQRAGGEVNLTGTLDNTNSVLNLANYNGSWQMLGGTIRGGQVSTTADYSGRFPTTTILYDGINDFSDSQNPNGAWSYGWTPTLGGTFTLDAHDTGNSSSSDGNAWGGNLDGKGDPGAYLSGISNGAFGSVAFSVTPTVEQTTGPAGQYSVVRWTAPSAGTVTLQGDYTAIVAGPHADVEVLDNGQSLGQVNYSTVGDNFFGPTEPIAVAAGDTIDFAVGDSGRPYGGKWDATDMEVAFTYNSLPLQTALIATTQGGTLDDVTLAGILDLATVAGSTVNIKNGLTDNGAVNIAQASSLVFAGPGTLGGSGNIFFADANTNNELSESGGGNFTIGPNVTIFGNTGKIDGGSGSFVNQATITGDAGAGLITVTGTNWNNAGTIGADSGGAVKLTGTWTSSGTIQADGGTASLDGTSWSNTGAITAIDSTVNLGGAFTTAGLGNFQRAGGLVNLTGTLDNTNAYLNLDSNTGSWQMAGGIIQGGQVATDSFAKSPTTTAIYDGNKDFSESQNPNGVWSYGWTPTLGGTFTLDSHDTGNPDRPGTFWGGNLDDQGDPSVSLTTVYLFGRAFGQGIEQTGGPDGEYSVVRWTAPSAGILGWYWDSAGASNFNLSLNPDVEVLDNGQSIAQAQLTTESAGALLGGIADTSVPVAQGDTIDFAVRGATWDALNIGVWFMSSQTQSLRTALIATTQGGTLDGVALAGSLDLATIPGSTMNAINGLTVNPALGDGGVNIGSGSSLLVAGGFNQQAGTSVIDGALNADSVNLGAGSYLSGSGVIQGNVTNAGHLGNASTPESLTIKGNFTQMATGVSEVALAGSAAGSGYGTINITGTGTFGGGLNVDVLDNLLPSKGETFTPLTVNGASGKFASVAGLPANITESVVHSGVVLTSKSPTPAELAITAKYDALGGAAGALGAGTAAVLATPSGGGYFESFQNGMLFWSPSKGIHELDSAAASEYAATASETNPVGETIAKVLGLPTSNDISTSMPGVDVVNFVGGKIYDSSTTGAHVLYGAMATEYAATAREKDAAGNNLQTALGLLTSDEAVFPGAPGATFVTFQNGSIYSSPTTGTHVLLGPIDAAFTAAAQQTDANGNSVQKILGLPTSDPTGIIIIGGSPGASITRFQGGSIYDSADTGAHVLYGPINTEYAALATEKDPSGTAVQSVVGLPTGDVTNVPGASIMSFQAGTIYWSSATGAHAVYGPIATEYLASANETDVSGYPVQGLLGLPIDEAARVGNQFVQRFQGGAIYQSIVSGLTHVLYGPLETEYENTAHETDASGNNVQALLGSLLGVVGAGTNSVTALFQGGDIYWSPDSNGAHVLYGPIATEYANTDQETDVNGNNVQDILGLPTMDEAYGPLHTQFTDANGTVLPVQIGTAASRVVTFQGGMILWSGSSGAHVLYGAIGDEYELASRELSFTLSNEQLSLGLPTQDEVAVSGVSGARVVAFQSGAIYWSSDTAAHAVFGKIGTLYQNMGGPTSYLGMPLSDEITLAGADPAHPVGAYNLFQNGKILFSANPKVGAYAIHGDLTKTYNVNINFSDGTPVGGWATLTVNADGSYTLSGHLHNSGFASYDATVTFALVSPSGVAYTFTHVGHMAGTVEEGSRDDDFTITGFSTDLANGWGDLEGGTEYEQTRATLDIGTVVDAIKSLADAAVSALARAGSLDVILEFGLPSPILAQAAVTLYHAVRGKDYWLLPPSSFP
jgi:hypothetical protein